MQMNNKLFVGNISWNVTSDDVKQKFEEVGEVEEVKLIIDRERGTHKGFGFVTMKTEEGAREAMEKLDGVELDGRPLRVNEAKPRSDER